MNRCPLCKRVYSADMIYCLEDGTALEKDVYHLSDPQAPTLIVPEGRDASTKNLRRHQLFLILRNKWLLIIVLTGVGIAAIIISQRGFIKSLLLAPPTTSHKPDMAFIPNGLFIMGPDESNPAENLAHHVLVDAFFMDKTEVTNSEYAEFIRETGHVTPDDWPNDKPPIGQEQWPVTYVSLADAEAFALWRSNRDHATYRLPTEEEWEYAARNGAQNNLYPWGDAWITNRAVTADIGSNFPKPVGSYPEGRNRWGVLDLIGNVSEWTSSKVYFKVSFYSPSIETPPNSNESVLKDLIVIRGGSAESKSSGEKAITATRRELIPSSAKDRRIGFRLVRDKEENRDINQPILN